MGKFYQEGYNIFSINIHVLKVSSLQQRQRVKLLLIANNVLFVNFIKFSGAYATENKPLCGVKSELRP